MSVVEATGLDGAVPVARDVMAVHKSPTDKPCQHACTAKPARTEEDIKNGLDTIGMSDTAHQEAKTEDCEEKHKSDKHGKYDDYVAPSEDHRRTLPRR